MEIEIMNEFEIPMFDKGDVVKDKFGNLFVIEDKVSPQQLEQDSDIYDFMGYRLKIIEKNPSDPTRMVGNVSGFHCDDKSMWIYNTRDDAVNDEVVVTDAHIFATELELYDAEDVLDEPKSKSKIQKPATPAKAEKAEITKRYPSIEDLQKISEENDLGNLLDQAYEILKEQASFGERNANLNFEKFKRCIPHFEREGFEITEHGTLIEVRW